MLYIAINVIHAFGECALNISKCSVITDSSIGLTIVIISPLIHRSLSHSERLHLPRSLRSTGGGMARGRVAGITA